MKFKENERNYYEYIPGTHKVVCYDKDGNIVDTVAFKLISDTLLNYCAVIQRFPWESVPKVNLNEEPDLYFQASKKRGW